MTYEEKVRHRAEELAHSFYIGCKNEGAEELAEWYESARDSMIHLHIEPARLSVQREADAYRAGYLSTFSGIVNDSIPCEQELQSLGLVPKN